MLKASVGWNYMCDGNYIVGTSGELIYKSAWTMHRAEAIGPLLLHGEHWQENGHGKKRFRQPAAASCGVVTDLSITTAILKFLLTSNPRGFGSALCPHSSNGYRIGDRLVRRCGRNVRHWSPFLRFSGQSKIACQLYKLIET